jgi:gamma-glutamyltranspeptidase/glutathione hydrolase
MSKLPINRSQARSMVVSTRGIVATEHPLASQAGALTLAEGGHAVDAAIAANAVMGVVCPMMCGVGGDLFAMVSEPDGTLYGVNGSGWAPAGLTPSGLERAGIRSMPQSGPHSVTIPGAVAGWGLLHGRFGRLPFARNLEAASVMADEGFPVAEITAEEWSNQQAFLRGDAEAARVFLPEDRAPLLGELFRNPDLAGVYRELANAGAETFYKGKLARRIIGGLERRGAAATRDDFSEFAAEWVQPISTSYRGWEVYEIPPNGAGIAALMMLNIMSDCAERFGGRGDADALHVMIEAKKLAYADMLRHVADPRWGAPPVDAMLSKEHAHRRAALIDPQRASESVTAGDLPVHAGDTTYLSVVDRDGNMVSLIQSNFASFGSGVVAEGTGFALQNRGALFTLDPAHPNVLAPRKRPVHTILPALMSRGHVRIAFGIMGGWNQSQAHAQFVSNVVDRGMNIQAALEAPRFTKLTFDGRDVMLEARFPAATRDGLSSLGHEVDAQGDYCSFMGGGQAVMRQDDVNYGASDPRKDGCALPEPIQAGIRD